METIAIDIRKARSEAMEHSLLPVDETYRLIEIYQGDPCPMKRKKALDRLSKHNIKLVAKITRRWYRVGGVYEFDELMDEGWIGFKTALDKFDIERGLSLSTYAVWWIRQAIGRYVTQNEYQIRIPVHLGDLVNDIRKILEQAQKNNLPEPTLARLLEQINAGRQNKVTLRSIESALKLLGGCFISLDAGDDDDGYGFLAHSDSDIEKTFDADELASLIDDVLFGDEFDYRDRMIIKMRFGLGGHTRIGKKATKGREYTLDEIAERFNLTRERIRQVEALAMGKLKRNPILAEYWKSVSDV